MPTWKYDDSDDLQVDSDSDTVSFVSEGSLEARRRCKFSHLKLVMIWILKSICFARQELKIDLSPKQIDAFDFGDAFSSACG